MVRDYLPLQQGLRLVSVGVEAFEEAEVRDYLPLQQGLRLWLTLSSLGLLNKSETIFHYNKD